MIGTQCVFMLHTIVRTGTLNIIQIIRKAVLASSTRTGEHHNLPNAQVDQKAFLVAAKEVLRTPGTRMTWDAFAALLGVEPRAMKTYRMPADSSDYRTMPRLLVEKIENFIAGAAETPDARPGPADPGPDQDPDQDAGTIWRPRTDALKLLPRSLAALVTRQAKQVFMGGGASMISGVDRLYSGALGLGEEDRRAMALVSRARLSLGLSDVGAEIHDLLAHCTKPLWEWLPLAVINEAGLDKVRLIDPDELAPTLEAEELAAGFSGMTSLLEEQVFAAFQDALSREPQQLANEYYSTVRTFVVRHPVVARAQLFKLASNLPMPVVTCMEQFYEALPRAMVPGETVQLCNDCGNLMQPYAGGLRCTTQACAAVHGANPGSPCAADGLMRLNRSLRKYWLEPGIDEMRLGDALGDAGHKVRYYPNRDLVDLDLGEGSSVGIDLKAYSSPELLGERLMHRPGGLRQYKKPLLVIPDWIAKREENYIDRVSACLEGSPIRTLTLSDAVKELGHA